MNKTLQMVLWPILEQYTQKPSNVVWLSNDLNTSSTPASLHTIAILPDNQNMLVVWNENPSLEDIDSVIQLFKKPCLHMVLITTRMFSNEIPIDFGLIIQTQLSKLNLLRNPKPCSFHFTPNAKDIISAELGKDWFELLGDYTTLKEQCEILSVHVQGLRKKMTNLNAGTDQIIQYREKYLEKTNMN